MCLILGILGQRCLKSTPKAWRERWSYVVFCCTEDHVPLLYPFPLAEFLTSVQWFWGEQRMADVECESPGIGLAGPLVGVWIEWLTLVTPVWQIVVQLSKKRKQHVQVAALSSSLLKGTCQEIKETLLVNPVKFLLFLGLTPCALCWFLPFEGLVSE